MAAAERLDRLATVLDERQQLGLALGGGAAIVLATLAQTTAVLYLPPDWPRVDWALAVALAWALQCGRGQGTALALLGGLLLDLASAAPFGLHLLALGLPVFLVENLRPRLGGGWPRRLVAILAAVILAHAIVLGALALRGWGIAWRTVILGTVLPAVGADFVVTVLLYLGLGLALGLLRPRPGVGG